MAERRVQKAGALVVTQPTDEVRRVERAGALVVTQPTDEVRRVERAGMLVVARIGRTWPAIEDANYVWYQEPAAGSSVTVWARHSFTVGGGVITGATLQCNADAVATFYLNGAWLASYTAGEDSAQIDTIPVSGSRLNTGTNVLAAKVVTDPAARGMLQFKLEVY